MILSPIVEPFFWKHKSMTCQNGLGQPPNLLVQHSLGANPVQVEKLLRHKLMEP